MRLLIVIVNYRTADLTVDCLRSLAPEMEGLSGGRVEVVDGGSDNGDAHTLAAAIRDNGWGHWATLRVLEANRGFAAANNAALRPALEGEDQPEHVLLLNPDTYLRRGAVRTLLGFMDAHPEVGIAGARLEDPDGTPQRSAFRFHGVRSELLEGARLALLDRLFPGCRVAPEPTTEPAPTDWVSGACMMVRGTVIEDVGLLDEGYFLYFEEMDFCLQARRAGWPCWYVPGGRVVHLVGRSTGITNATDQRRRRPTYWFESRRRYFIKNFGRGVKLLADLAFAAGLASFRVRQMVQGKPDRDPPRLLRDFLAFNFSPRGFQR